MLGRKYYAGIGSRKTPEWACKLLSQLSYILATEGKIARHGLAIGADEAIFNGVQAFCGEDRELLDKLSEGYIPWNGFMKRWYFHMAGVILVQDDVLLEKARKIAKQHMSQSHWEACTEQAQELHCRNSFQLFGETLNKPVGQVICWGKPTGKGQHVQGGTGQGIRIAIKRKIIIRNLATPEGLRWAKNKIQKFLDKGNTFPACLT